ncbi:ARF guanine nucleotide exchange factor [Nosema bombycis CQ1]|uniref:ARF guanine nucleotide exchange factor n=1 Tax=Nosema bombycis (strain CQ1 / CVCC 102059) TaxID=578461 RepID=R0MIS3_NOSB1|nr:ARF guanine nucleotide exchange factor [Nosema bombycis CQ1]|eukprot:EOB12698.1 ARF guanine nucleotide exchange factor [Nosema bombycis CQ1]
MKLQTNDLQEINDLHKTNSLQEIQILIFSLPCTNNKEFTTIIKEYELDSSIDHIITLFDKIFSISKYTNTDVYHFLNIFSKFVDCVGPKECASLSVKVRSLKFFPSEKDTDLVIVKYFEVINKMSLIMENEELQDVYSRYIFLQSKDIVNNVMVHFIYSKFKDFLKNHPIFLEYTIEKGLYKEMRLKNEFLMDFFPSFNKVVLIDSSFDMNLGLRIFIINNTKNKYLFQEFFNDIPSWYLKSLTPHLVPFLYYNFDIYGIYRELALEYCNVLSIDEFQKHLENDLKNVKGVNNEGCVEDVKGDVKDVKVDPQSTILTDKSQPTTLPDNPQSTLITDNPQPTTFTDNLNPLNTPITLSPEIQNLRSNLKESISLFNKTLDLDILVNRFGQIESFLLLRSSKSTSLKSLGEFLCKSKNEDYLRLFTSTFDFTNLTLIESLRAYLASFFLVGESQVIHRVLTIFSEKYFIDNVGKILIDDDKTRKFLFNFSFSLLVLNTKMYNPNIKTKPTFHNHMSDFNEEEIPSNFSMEYLKSQFESVCEQKMELAVRNKAGRHHFLIYENLCKTYGIPTEFCWGFENVKGGVLKGVYDKGVPSENGVPSKGSPLNTPTPKSLTNPIHHIPNTPNTPYPFFIFVWSDLFKKLISNFFDAPPDHFFLICDLIKERKLIERYLRENKSDTGRFLSMFKYYTPLEGDLEIYKMFLGILKRLEKPRHGVFSEIKNSLIKGNKPEVRDTILTQFRKSFYEIVESKFNPNSLLLINLSLKDLKSNFIFNLICEIYENHLESLEDLSMIPDDKISLILDRLVITGNRSKFCTLSLFMTPENLLIYYKNMLETVPRFLNGEICETFKKIGIYNEDAFCIVLNIQKEYDLFEFVVEIHEEKIECRGVYCDEDVEGEGEGEEKGGKVDEGGIEIEGDTEGIKEKGCNKNVRDAEEGGNERDTEDTREVTRQDPNVKVDHLNLNESIYLFKDEDFIDSNPLFLFKIPLSKDILGCFSFKEKFEDIMRIPTNLFHFYASSKSILNQSKAKTIHKAGCPLKESIFNPLEMDPRLIYMLKKADSLNNKDVTNYTLWVVNLISSSLPIFCRFFTTYFGLLLTIKNSNLVNPIIKIFCSRLGKTLSGNPLCCKCGYKNLGIVENFIKFLIKYELANIKDFEFYFKVRNEKIKKSEIIIKNGEMYLEEKSDVQ